MVRAIGAKYAVLIEDLERLPDREFVTLFRRFLNKNQYPYPDDELLQDRYMAVLVLLADIDHSLVRTALDENWEKRKHRPETDASDH